MAQVIPATSTVVGPLSSVVVLPTDSNPTVASGLAVGAGTNTTDTPQALTVTGRRFFFETRLYWTGASTTAGMGLAFTGSPRFMFLETEQPITSNNVTTISRGSASPSSPFAPTTPVVITCSGNITPGTIINRGWVDYAASGTYTFTPVYYTGTSTNAYGQRSFRVDTWA